MTEHLLRFGAIAFPRDLRRHRPAEVLAAGTHRGHHADLRAVHQLSDATSVPVQQLDLHVQIGGTALAALDIATNYELIRTLEPFMRGRTGQYHDFVAAVRSAVTQYLPDLLPHIDEILAFAVLYYEVRDSPQLAGANRQLT